MVEIPAKDSQWQLTSLPARSLRAEQLRLLERAIELKGDRLSCAPSRRSVALVFDKPSTRTRVSFDVGIHELGGHPVVLRQGELQLARGVAARRAVLSRMVHAVGIRTGPHELVEELAAAASVPVINMLTHEHHPCQALADLMTLRERFGTLEGLKLGYVGDGNNMARSLIIAGQIAGVEVAVASRPSCRFPRRRGRAGGGGAGAHALYTDVWVSMGDEADAERRRELLAPYRIDAELLAQARDDAVVLHCLPAHPGEEITEDILYEARSRRGTRPRTACTPRRHFSSIYSRA